MAINVLIRTAFISLKGLNEIIIIYLQKKEKYENLFIHIFVDYISF